MNKITNKEIIQAKNKYEQERKLANQFREKHKKDSFLIIKNQIIKSIARNVSYIDFEIDERNENEVIFKNDEIFFGNKLRINKNDFCDIIINGLGFDLKKIEIGSYGTDLLSIPVYGYRVFLNNSEPKHENTFNSISGSIFGFYIACAILFFIMMMCIQ